MSAEPRLRTSWPRAMRELARSELIFELRGRTLPYFGVAFALAALLIALVGMAAGGSIVVQDFARTSVSLLQLSLWVVPLVALPWNAIAAADGYDMETLAAQPVSRATLVIGRALGRYAALASALALGYGVAGLVVLSSAGPGDGLRFLALLAVTLLLAMAMTALGTLAGTLARSRTRALAAAVGLWFALVIGFDLVAIALLAVLPRTELTWGLTGLLLLDPVDIARALGVGLVGADAVAGPMGAALRKVLGAPGLSVLAMGLLAWTAWPAALAARVFRKADL